MPGLGGTSDRHDQLLRELAEERFAALARIARTLERQIDQLRQLRAALVALSGVERERALKAYHDLRAQAIRYRWYMEVQREVVGLRPHELVERFYQVPGPVD